LFAACGIFDDEYVHEMYTGRKDGQYKGLCFEFLFWNTPVFIVSKFACRTIYCNQGVNLQYEMIVVQKFYSVIVLGGLLDFRNRPVSSGPLQ